jgi:hypothetical protein
MKYDTPPRVYSRRIKVLPPSTNKYTFKHVLSQTLLILTNSVEKVESFMILN